MVGTVESQSIMVTSTLAMVTEEREREQTFRQTNLPLQCRVSSSNTSATDNIFDGSRLKNCLLCYLGLGEREKRRTEFPERFEISPRYLPFAMKSVESPKEDEIIEHPSF